MTKQILPGYKQTKVGIIPENWEVVQLGEAVDFLDHRRKPLKDEERQQIQGKYPYYGASGIIDYVNDYIFDEDLLLLGEDGANIIDRSSRLAFIARGKYWVNNHAHVLKPKQMFNHYYLCEYLESLKYDKYNTGTAQPKLNKEIVSSIPIIRPPLKEQEKIAEILSTWDDAITKLEQLIEQKQVFKKGIMQQIFSQKLRFKDDNGNDYPAWQSKKLSECLIFTPREVNKPTVNYLAIGVRSHAKGTFQKNNVESDSNTMQKMYIVRNGDLIVNITFAWEGAIAIVKSSDDGGYVSHRFPTYTFNTACAISSYFNFIICRKHFISMLDLISPGGAGRNRVLSKSAFINLNVNLPCVHEQSKIASFLTNIDDEITKQTEILDQLKLQKQSLMQKLLTGQVRTYSLSKEIA